MILSWTHVGVSQSLFHRVHILCRGLHSNPQGFMWHLASQLLSCFILGAMSFCHPQANYLFASFEGRTERWVVVLGGKEKGMDREGERAEGVGVLTPCWSWSPVSAPHTSSWESVLHSVLGPGDVPAPTELTVQLYETNAHITVWSPAVISAIKEKWRCWESCRQGS